MRWPGESRGYEDTESQKRSIEGIDVNEGWLRCHPVRRAALRATSGSGRRPDDELALSAVCPFAFVAPVASF